MLSGRPFRNFISFTDPFGPPSPDAPLSDTSTTSVFSRQPYSSRNASNRPISASAWPRNPAYTSAIRANKACSSADNESQGRVTSSSGNGLPSGPVRVSVVPIGLIGGTSVSGGTMPIAFWRANVSARSASYP